MRSIVGWDIGGVNTKVARVVGSDVVATGARPFAIERDRTALAPLLRELARAAAVQDTDVHAVTMTAELSQVFRTKRDGVVFVLDAVDTAFPGACVRVYAVDGRFVSSDVARREPLAVAAANWAATARLVARTHPDCLLVDIGSTTTDVIPIVGGEVVARGRTDPERLREGELIYTGALRTPVEAITSVVELDGLPAGVSAEGFAIAADVHLWLGAITAEEYTCPTPDGRPTTRAYAAERLARVVCADRDMLDDAAIDAIAARVADAQMERVAAAMDAVRRRHPALRLAVLTGLGEFIAVRAARRTGLGVASLAGVLGPAARHAPAAAVALLCATAELSPV
ncbi:MAG TPA: hydantoinase/oxoprolinase family protein [Gemmatimonadales bacterium]|nr:hydantoinase/oxoprolinase family protein [Gemmatimonadales bacterium]